MTSNKSRRKYYLQDVPMEDAFRLFSDALRQTGWLAPTSGEFIPLKNLVGRVTAKPVWAKVSSPHYDGAAMDGIAIRASDTTGASETSPIHLKIGEQAVWIDTGDPIPEGFDAVVMVEVVHLINDCLVELQTPVAPYQHIRVLGEDIVATELVLPENRRIGPYDIAACAASGISEVSVRRLTVASILPTGSELVSVGEKFEPGQIIDSNGLMLATMLEEWGAEASILDSVPDDIELIEHAVKDSLKLTDLLIVNAGSSAGSSDYTAQIFEALGDVLVHGVAIRPGHPLVLGVIDGKPVLGIPGYPVSAAITCELFLKPLLEGRLGIRNRPKEKLKAVMTRKVISPIGEDEYLRVRAGRVGDRNIATPIQRGAGVIMSLVRADGFVTIPRFSEGIDAGEEVDIELLRSTDDLEDTVVIIGSHDIALDLLASELQKFGPGRPTSISSSNVGSLGGLLALSRGEAHMSGCHLLDDISGEYNISFIKRYLKGQDAVLVNFVDRLQGFIVPPGNPHSLDSLEDLAQNQLRFVNRQRGSGTRILLDYMLRQNDILPESITGYEREEYNHLAVAAAVAENVADVGLGVMSAARALGMDFVPLLSESYDLLIPTRFYNSELLKPVLSMINSDEFKSKVSEMGGYVVSRMGDVVFEFSGQGESVV